VEISKQVRTVREKIYTVPKTTVTTRFGATASITRASSRHLKRNKGCSMPIGVARIFLLVAFKTHLKTA